MSFDPQQQLQQTAYGELSTAQPFPITQVSAKYSLLEGTLSVVDGVGSGTVQVADGKYTISTGIDPTGLASILSLRQIPSRPGQGALCRISAIFPDINPDSSQIAGLITSEASFGIGVRNGSFGVVYFFGGKNEAQELTITTPAAGAEVAAVDVDGITYFVNLTAATAEVNATEIASQLFGVVPNYLITANEDQVYFIALIPEPQGAFAFNSATAIAAFVQQTAGVTPTEANVPQSDWNIDKKPDLDPATLNFYQVRFDGFAIFSVVDKESGEYVDVHKIVGANQLTDPLVENPTFRTGWLTQNQGSTADNQLEGTNAAIFNEGLVVRETVPNSLSVEALSVGTTATSLITIRNRTHFGDKINRAEIFPFLVSGATQANKVAFFELILEPTFAVDPIFEYIDRDNSITEFSTENIAVTGGQVIGTLTIEAGNSQFLELNRDLVTPVFPGATVVISARVSSGAAGDMQASVSWQEDT